MLDIDPHGREVRDDAPAAVADGETTTGDDDAGAGILARDVTVTYRNGHTALHAASFAIPRGTITALVGVNGAGKSTLFKAIMGFVPTARGEIRLLGRTVREALGENLVAYVPQSEEVDWAFPVLVEDVVMMGRYGHMGFLRRARRADRDAVDEALGRVGMRDYRERQIGELSGGQRKRVFLARALAQDGQVILLDEPFTGVDVTTEEQIVTLLRELRDEGRVMLVSTHNLGSVPEFCDRTVLLGGGTVLTHGPTAGTFTGANLERAFGGVLRHFTLGGDTLHDDDDPREISIITDDERPLVHYGERPVERPGAAAEPAPTGGDAPLGDTPTGGGSTDRGSAGGESAGDGATEGGGTGDGPDEGGASGRRNDGGGA